MKDKKPSIYIYKDFVEFLKDAIGFCQKKENTSLREFCKKLNISVSLLSMVLHKKRIPTDSLLKKVYLYLGLSAVEIKYANQLKTIYKSKEIEIQKASLESLSKKKHFRDAHRSEYEFSKYLSKWYYVAIKELAGLVDFRENADWIQSKLAFNVTKTEVRKALSFLKQSGILITENGKLASSQRQMNCEDGIFRISLGGFHKQILNLVSKSIDTVPRDQRLLLGYTLALSDTNREAANSILIEAFEKIKNLDAQIISAKQTAESSAEIYHIELAAIPLSKSGDKNEKK